MPKSRTSKQIGDDNEIQVACLLKEAGWLPWRVPKARFARDDRFESQDVWDSFDIVALRRGQKVLGAQVGVHMAHKRRQVEELFARLGGYLHSHLSSQVWLIERDRNRIVVDELVDGRWNRLGYCTIDGDKLEGGEPRPWPLGRI